MTYNRDNSAVGMSYKPESKKRMSIARAIITHSLDFILHTYRHIDLFNDACPSAFNIPQHTPVAQRAKCGGTNCWEKVVVLRYSGSSLTIGVA
jgi:hypothetical protein